MRSLQLSFILVAFCIALVASDIFEIRTRIIPFYDLYRDGNKLENLGLDVGQRSYTFTSGPGIQGRPVYNFGLGKRGYDFQNDINDNDGNYGKSSNNLKMQQFPFNFGNGNREKRQINRYNFGLGKR